MTISVDCAPPASSPNQHKEWLEDVALFEKQNPNITVNSIFENPCEVPASFTAMLKAGNEPNVFYTYFTDKNQVLDAGQAADITSYVNSKQMVPALKDIVPTALAAVTAGKTLYGLPTVNYTQGLIINRVLFKQAGLNRTSRLPPGPRSSRTPRRSPSSATASTATATTARATTEAGTSPPRSSPRVAR